MLVGHAFAQPPPLHRHIRRFVQVLVEQPHQTAIHVDQGHTAGAFGGQTGPPDQAPHDLEGKFGLLRDVDQQLIPGNDRTDRRDHGLHMGRSRPAVQGHFPHVLQRAIQAQGQFLAIFVGQKCPQATLQHDVKGVTSFALLYQQGSPPVAALQAAPRQRGNVDRGVRRCGNGRSKACGHGLS